MNYEKNIYLILFLIFGVTVVKKVKKTDNHNTVVFCTLQLSSFDKYVKRIISDFEKENPGIKIQWIDVPYSEGEKRTLAAIMTDNPPDLINLTPDFSLLLAQRNALYTFDETNLRNFIPEIAEILKYKNKYFAIPFYVTSAVTLYNKSLYNGTLPKSYSDLFKIVPAKGTYITMFNFTENDTLLKLLNKYNINSFENINSKESVHLFSEIKRLYDNNYIPKESVTQTHRDSLEKYMSGKLIFLVTGANFINMIKENAPSVYENTIILPQLTGATKKYDYSIMNFVIPKKAKNPEYALKFAALFRNPLAMISPSSFMDLVNIPEGRFDKITGELTIKNNVVERILIKSSSPQLSSLIFGRFDLITRDATLRIYTKFSSSHKGFSGFLRNISLNSLANRVPLGSRNDSNYYEAELKHLPPIDADEKDCQVFLTKVDGDVEKNNFISSLKKIK